MTEILLIGVKHQTNNYFHSFDWLQSFSTNWFQGTKTRNVLNEIVFQTWQTRRNTKESYKKVAIISRVLKQVFMAEWILYETYEFETHLNNSFTVALWKCNFKMGWFFIILSWKSARERNTCDFNSLPNDKILNWSKVKAFADANIKVLKKLIFVFDGVENIVGKGENAGYQHFLLFPQCFEKFFTQCRDCVVKSYKISSRITCTDKCSDKSAKILKNS